MTKRRGMYKEYIQILPSADAETAPPLVTCSETISGLALPPPGGHAGDSRECEPAASPPSAPDLPPELLFDPVAAPMARARVPSDGRIALIAATLALALSTGALTWMLSRTALSQPTDAVAALSTEIAGLKGRLAAADEPGAGRRRPHPGAGRAPRPRRPCPDRGCRLPRPFRRPTDVVRGRPRCPRQGGDRGRDCRHPALARRHHRLDRLPARRRATARAGAARAAQAERRRRLGAARHLAWRGVGGEPPRRLRGGGRHAVARPWPGRGHRAPQWPHGGGHQQRPDPAARAGVTSANFPLDRAAGVLATRRLRRGRKAAP